MIQPWSQVSESSRRRLAAILGQEPDERDPFALPRAGGPTLVQVRGPDDDLPVIVDDLLDALDGDLAGGRRVALALRRKRSQFLGVADGQPTIDGRHCCWEVGAWLDQHLGEIKPEELFRCRGCGAIWTIANLVREERRHA